MAAGPRPGTGGPALRGLFCGGTLADEAMLVAAATLGRHPSATSRHAPELALGADLTDPGHVVIDFGDDGLTRGRAHPMIDPTLRLERIAARGRATRPAACCCWTSCSATAPTPTRPASSRSRRSARAPPTPTGRALPVVVSLTGTEGDPQGRSRCAAALRRGRRRGVPLQRRGHPPRRSPSSGARDDHASRARPLRGLLDGEPVVVTAGVALFADALREQAVPVTEVDWRPPMAGTEADLARVMADPRRAAANRTAVERMPRAGRELVDVRPASEALGLERGTFLHSGPPLDWERARARCGARSSARCCSRAWPTPPRTPSAARRGRDPLEPCHHRGAVGPMAGVISPVDVGLRAARRRCTARLVLAQRGPGQGAALRRLRPRGDRPAALDARRARPDAAAGRARAPAPIDIKAIIAQMLQMGDEGHNRNRAGTLMLLRELLPG